MRTRGWDGLRHMEKRGSSPARARALHVELHASALAFVHAGADTPAMDPAEGARATAAQVVGMRLVDGAGRCGAFQPVGNSAGGARSREQVSLNCGSQDPPRFSQAVSACRGSQTPSFR